MQSFPYWRSHSALTVCSTSLKENGVKKRLEGSVPGGRSLFQLRVGSPPSSPDFVVEFCTSCYFSHALLPLVLSQILEDRIMLRLLFLGSSYPAQHSSLRPRDSSPGISLSLKNYSFSAKEPLELSSRWATELCPGPFKLPSQFPFCRLRALFWARGETNIGSFRTTILITFAELKALLWVSVDMWPIHHLLPLAPGSTLTWKPHNYTTASSGAKPLVWKLSFCALVQKANCPFCPICFQRCCR